ALRERLEQWQFALVLTSPRRRARDTCELAGLADRAGGDDDLAEWNYGEDEGRTTAEIRERGPGWTILTGHPPGGETADQGRARRPRARARRGGRRPGRALLPRALPAGARRSLDRARRARWSPARARHGHALRARPRARPARAPRLELGKLTGSSR